MASLFPGTGDKTRRETETETETETEIETERERDREKWEIYNEILHSIINSKEAEERKKKSHYQTIFLLFSYFNHLISSHLISSHPIPSLSHFTSLSLPFLSYFTLLPSYHFIKVKSQILHLHQHQHIPFVRNTITAAAINSAAQSPITL